MPAVRGRALRSMSDPGTAYDDPVLGRDPQVGSMADYVQTTQDNGGVHLNSGIPNRAFHLAATGIGGASWEGAGPIWYAALTSGIGPRAGFADFAAATVSAAAQVSPSARDAVLDAWTAVGVARGRTAGEPWVTPSVGERVAVTRSGGFAGLRQSGEVLLGDDPRTPEVERLLGRVDLARVSTSRPQPDRCTSTRSWWPGRRSCSASRTSTPELEQLARLVLEDRP